MGPLKPKLRVSIGLLFLLVCLVVHVVSHSDDPDIDDDETTVETEIEPEFVYKSPVPSGPVYMAENFDDFDLSKKRWTTSKAHKQENENAFKYDGRWEFELPQKPIFPNDRALVLRSKARHAAISTKMAKPFVFKDKPLFVQYEVNFQNGMECGGAYIKLLSDSKDLNLEQFHDKTPYTIMFGPDKCGNDIKHHFIFRHKNPINGSFEEKHAKRPSNRLEETFNDKKPHVYLLKLTPDNKFEVIIDGRLINSGSLLTDMEPPVNPPLEIEDPDDSMPADWDEREKIPDESAVKPDDWDEDAPRRIQDPDSVKPEDWLEDEPLMIPDESAVKPEDWDESMDGTWEPPVVNNPKCQSVSGCGPWAPPMIDNPNFKGKWKPPMIDNPHYKGVWTPKKIPNPNYFEDKEPFLMTPFSAVGLEIWTMTDNVLFDNFIITDDENVLKDWTEQTFELKRRAMDKDAKNSNTTLMERLLKKMKYQVVPWSLYFIYCAIPIGAYMFYLIGFAQREGVIRRLINYSNAHPWLWAVYIFVIGLPLVLLFTFCCGGSQKEKLDARHKKTDDVLVDDVMGQGDGEERSAEETESPLEGAEDEQSLSGSNDPSSMDDMEEPGSSTDLGAGDMPSTKRRRQRRE